MKKILLPTMKLNGSNHDLLNFKENFKRLFSIFAALQELYLDDDPQVLAKLGSFRRYLQNFNECYPSLQLTLKERDLTSDDLIILLSGITFEHAKEKYPTLLLKERGGKAQLLINKKDMDIDSSSFHLLAFIGCSCQNKRRDLKIPEELHYLPRDIKERYSGSDNALANRTT